LTVLADDIVQFYDDPYKFVLYAFPWGEEGTPLQGHMPDEWQMNLLNTIRDEIRKRDGDSSLQTAIQMAVTSGHGIGKSALTSWLLLWFISTRPHPQILVTANTQNQLTSKTWRELSKWHKLAINRDWFEWTATRFYFKEQPETWFASAIPWSENRPDAFAGTHEEHVLVIFDEASGIPDSIWEVTEGAMTTSGAMWFAFGNPNRNTGRFRECFGRFRHRWTPYKIDSRTAKMANLQQIEQWKLDYGEDSDFFKIRVRGEFPTSASNQFIASDSVDACMVYKAVNYLNFPYIIGVDVARFGDDMSVIAIRQGRKLNPLLKFRNLDTVQLSHKIAEISSGYPNATIFIDGVGVGAGVVDYCKAIGLRVIEVNAGCTADDAARYANKRAEMWDKMRQWMKDGAELPNDPELKQDCIGIEYGYTMKGQIQLEKKEDMKRRGLGSPDCADALSLTFAAPVAVSKNNFRKPLVAKVDWTVY